MSRPAAVLGGYVYFPLCVATSGHLCLTGSNGFDGAGCELRLWDVRKQAQIAQLDGHAQVLARLGRCCGGGGGATATCRRHECLETIAAPRVSVPLLHLQSAPRRRCAARCCCRRRRAARAQRPSRGTARAGCGRCAPIVRCARSVRCTYAGRVRAAMRPRPCPSRLTRTPCVTSPGARRDVGNYRELHARRRRASAVRGGRGRRRAECPRVRSVARWRGICAERGGCGAQRRRHGAGRRIVSWRVAGPEIRTRRAATSIWVPASGLPARRPRHRPRARAAPRTY